MIRQMLADGGARGEGGELNDFDAFERVHRD
jgi:hypothetical protein